MSYSQCNVCGKIRRDHDTTCAPAECCPELHIREYVDRKEYKYELRIGFEIVWAGDSPPDAEIAVCDYKGIPVADSVLVAKALWDASHR